MYHNTGFDILPSNPKSFIRKILPTAHRVLVEKIISDELVKVSGRVLVIGAGHNPYGSLLSSAASVIVSDISDEYGKIDQIVDAHALPYDESSFDAIIAIEVIEHLEFPIKASQEFYRVLTKGGRVISSIPFMFHIHGDPYDYQRLTRQGILNLFSDYQSISVSEIGGRLAVISDIITTGSIYLIPLRILNNILHFPILRSTHSSDCPSGYWIEAIK